MERAPGGRRIQYERGGTIKQCIMDLDVATTMFDTCIEVNDEGARMGIQLYCPLFTVMLSKLPVNRSETSEKCNTCVASIADLFYHTPSACPNAEFRTCLPLVAKDRTFEEISSLGAFCHLGA